MFAAPLSAYGRAPVGGAMAGPPLSALPQRSGGTS